MPGDRLAEDVGEAAVASEVEEPVGPEEHRLHALGVGAQGHARNVEADRLLLDPAAVAEDRGGAAHRPTEVEVADGLGDADVGRPGQAELLDALRCAGVHGEEDRHVDGAQLPERPPEHLGVIDCGLAMHRQDGISRLVSDLFRQGTRGDHVPVPAPCIHDQVADGRAGDGVVALERVQEPGGEARGSEPQVGHAVDADAVHLLGHGPVEGADARLDVDQDGAGLFGRQGRGESGVGVAVADDDLGPEVSDRIRRGGGQCGMIRAAHVQEASRRGRLELIDEDLHHGRRVVLAGEEVGVLEAIFEKRHEGCELDELGPGSSHSNDAHSIPLDPGPRTGVSILVSR